jgi:hypothetical protein
VCWMKFWCKLFNPLQTRFCRVFEGKETGELFACMAFGGFRETSLEKGRDPFSIFLKEYQCISSMEILSPRDPTSPQFLNTD